MAESRTQRTIKDAQISQHTSMFARNVRGHLHSLPDANTILVCDKRPNDDYKLHGAGQPNTSGLRIHVITPQ